MPAREGLASVSLGSTKEIGLWLVADARFENLSEACRIGPPISIALTQPD